MALLSITATQWNYNGDLTQGPAIFGASYVEMDGFYAAENIINQATSGDRIRIYVLVNGGQEMLGDFLVDDYSISENDSGTVGELRGRDAKALLLESFPATSTTYRGLSISSDCSITGGVSASTALAGIIQAAGFTPSINIDDYILGQDFVHTSEISYGEAITQLLQPHRVTEKHYADVILRGNTLWVWQRTNGTPFGNVTVNYTDLIDRKVERQRPSQPSSIQVYGATYSCFELETPTLTSENGGGVFFVGPIMGWPWHQPYTIKDTKEVYHPSLGILLYTIGREWNFGSNGKANSAKHIKRYSSSPVFDGEFFIGTYPIDRTETITETFEYSGPFGELSKYSFEKYVSDTSIMYEFKLGKIIATNQKFVNQVTKRITTEWTYATNDYFSYIGKSDPIASNTVNEECDERLLVFNVGAPPISPAGVAPLIVRSLTNNDYKNTGGQLQKSSLTDTFDPRTGALVLAELESVELGINRLETNFTPGGGQPLIPMGRRPVSKQFKCSTGNDQASSKFTFPYIGSNDNCCRFLNLIANGRASWKVLANFTILPNLNVREGMTITINGAPSRWGVSTFYITGRSFERTTSGLVMRLVGVAWI